MVKLQEFKGQFTVSIPTEKIKNAGWKKGDLLDCNFDNRTGEIVLKRVQP